MEQPRRSEPRLLYNNRELVPSPDLYIRYTVHIHVKYLQQWERLGAVATLVAFSGGLGVLTLHDLASIVAPCFFVDHSGEE